jgi:DNA-directed RNA polymerase specialized sigma24 family protein
VAIVAAVVTAARNWDMTAAKIILDRLVPVRRAVSFDLPRIECKADVVPANTSGGNARAWLLAITRNTAFTWLARNRSKAHVTTEDIETQAPADGATPEEALIAKASAAAIELAIAALQPPFREALVLRDINGLSYRDIAEITGVPLGTVMSDAGRGFVSYA